MKPIKDISTTFRHKVMSRPPSISLGTTRSAANLAQQYTIQMPQKTPFVSRPPVVPN